MSWSQKVKKQAPVQVEPTTISSSSTLTIQKPTKSHWFSRESKISSTFLQTYQEKLHYLYLNLIQPYCTTNNCKLSLEDWYRLAYHSSYNLLSVSDMIQKPQKIKNTTNGQKLPELSEKQLETLANLDDSEEKASSLIFFLNLGEQQEVTEKEDVETKIEDLYMEIMASVDSYDELFQHLTSFHLFDLLYPSYSPKY